jgi:hypothetical protein
VRPNQAMHSSGRASGIPGTDEVPAFEFGPAHSTRGPPPTLPPPDAERFALRSGPCGGLVIAALPMRIGAA